MFERAVLFQGLSRILPQALGFVLGVVIVRSSGVEIMGQYAQYLAVGTMTFGVIASGINTHFLRSGIPRQFLTAVTLILITAVIVSILFLPVYSLAFQESYLGLLFFLTTLVMMRIGDLYGVLLRFLNKDLFIILPKSLPIFLILILTILIKPQSIQLLGAIFAFSWLTFLIFFYSSRRMIKGMVQSISISRKALVAPLVISGSTLATQLYGNMDQLIIANILGDQASGNYRISVSFSSLAIPIVGVFSFMFLSRLKRLLNNPNKLLLKKEFRNQIFINTSVGTLFFIFCVFSLWYVIPFIYGKGSEESVIPAIILSLGIMLNVIATTFSYSLLSINKEKSIFSVAMIGAIVNIISNLALIPSLGILGGAVSSVLTQLVILILLSYLTIYKFNFLRSGIPLSV